MAGKMVSGFYLVSKDANKENEVELFRKLCPNIKMNLIYFEDIIPIVEKNQEKILTVDGELEFPDFVFIRAFNLGEKQYHLKSVLRMLEYNGVVCFNPPDTKDKTSDKLFTNQLINSVVENVKVPKTILVTPEIDADKICGLIGLPVVIKIMHGSSGKGLSLIKSRDELDNLLNIVFAAPFDDQIIAQEAILSSKGRDIRLVIAQGEVIDSFVRSNQNDFKSNVSTGGSVVSFNPPTDLVEDALKIADTLDLKLGSVDFLFGEKKDEFYFCEANSTIGLPYLVDAYKNGDKDLIEKYLRPFKNLF